jgi:hypothetical protein
LLTERLLFGQAFNCHQTSSTTGNGRYQKGVQAEYEAGFNNFSGISMMKQFSAGVSLRSCMGAGI